MTYRYHNSRHGVEGAASFTSRNAFALALTAVGAVAAVEVLDRPIAGVEANIVEHVSTDIDGALNDIGGMFGDNAIVREF